MKSHLPSTAKDRPAGLAPSSATPGAGFYLALSRVPRARFFSRVASCRLQVAGWFTALLALLATFNLQPSTCSAAQFRNYVMTSTNSSVVDTNYLIITKISPAIRANGSVIAQGIPQRTPRSPWTNALAQGFYSVTNPVAVGGYVINIDFDDNSATVYDHTNYIHPGHNTYVMRSVTSNEIVTALGFVPGTGSAANAVTNSFVPVLTLQSNLVLNGPQLFATNLAATDSPNLQLLVWDPADGQINPLSTADAPFLDLGNVSFATAGTNTAAFFVGSGALLTDLPGGGGTVSNATSPLAIVSGAVQLTGQVNATNLPATISSDTTGNADTATKATRADQDRTGEAISILGDWEPAGNILTNGDAIDSTNAWNHIASLSRLPNGTNVLWYGSYTNASLSGTNYGGIKAAISRTMDGFNSGKLGYIIHPSNITSVANCTYVNGPSVTYDADSGLYLMTVFCGTNSSGQFEGETSCSVLLMSTNGLPEWQYWNEVGILIPFPPQTGTNEWDVRNIFAGHLLKVDNLWYYHYIAYQPYPWNSGSTNYSTGFLHYMTNSTSPTNLAGWTKAIGHQIVWEQDGDAAGNIGGAGAVGRLSNGDWWAPLGSWIGVSASPHPTNFILSASHGAAETDFYYIGQDDGAFAINDGPGVTAIRVYRPVASTRPVRATTFTSQSVTTATFTATGPVKIPAGTVGKTNLSDAIIAGAWNLELPTPTTDTNYFFIKLSGPIGFDGLWVYQTNNLTFTNENYPGTRWVYDLNDDYGTGIFNTMIATNADHPNVVGDFAGVILSLGNPTPEFYAPGSVLVPAAIGYFSETDVPTNYFSGIYEGTFTGTTLTTSGSITGASLTLTTGGVSAPNAESTFGDVSADGITANTFTGSGAGLTSLQSTNIVGQTGLLAASAATNYVVPLLSGSGNDELKINAANTNIFITFTGTNTAFTKRALVIDALTNTVTTTIRFGQTVLTNILFDGSITNRQVKWFYFYNLDTTGTNVTATDGGIWR